MSTILVIEPEPAVREEILRILRFEEYQVLEARDAGEGVDLAARHRPDCILCDLPFACPDRGQILSRLRVQAGTETIPVILLAGGSTHEEIRSGMAMGADDYLPKPFTVEELLAAVGGRLARKELVRHESERRLADLRDSITVALPHELRTPLTVVLGFAELLEMAPDAYSPPEIAGMAADIHTAASRLQHLVENFLLYAQLEIFMADPEQVRAVRESVSASASAIIGDAARRASRAEAREGDLELELDPAELRVSEEHLDRLATEVITNAFKFSTPGTPVKVRGAPTTEPGHYRLSVRDDGRGMSPSEIATVGALTQFGRRLHEQQGPGLGLVIARRLADLYGGGLEILSEPGAGATVTVSLPLA